MCRATPSCSQACAGCARARATVSREARDPRAAREVERVGPSRRPGPGASELQLTAFINSWVARAAEVTGHDGSLKSLVM